MGDCISKSTLQKQVEGKLTDDENDQVADHVDNCQYCSTRSEEIRETLALPSALIDAYEVKRKLGSGTYGKVFLCRDKNLERDVAVKILYDSKQSQDWLSEARNACQVRHENIVTIYSVEDSPPHIFMEYVEGEDLSSFLDQHTLPPDSAAEIAKSIATGLSAIQKAGIVHRDLKPANILMSKDGRIVLTDFGLSADLTRQQTHELSQAATIPYISPEQAETSLNNASFATDVYSLGVVFYQLLTRNLPFEGTKDELLNVIPNGVQVTPRSRFPLIPKQLESICLKAMSKSADDRYENAADFAVAIADYQRKKSLKKILKKTWQIGTTVLLFVFAIWVWYLINLRTIPPAELLGLKREVTDAFESYESREVSPDSAELKSKLLSANDLLMAGEFTSASVAYKSVEDSLHKASYVADIADLRQRLDRCFALGGGEDETFLLFPDLEKGYSSVSKPIPNQASEQEHYLSKLQSYVDKVENEFEIRAKHAAFKLGAYAAFCTTMHEYNEAKMLNGKTLKMSTMNYRHALDTSMREGLEFMKQIGLPPDCTVKFKEGMRPDYIPIPDVRRIMYEDPLGETASLWETSVAEAMRLGWNVTLGCCNEYSADRKPVIDYIAESEQFKRAGVPMNLQRRMNEFLEQSLESNAIQIKAVSKEYLKFVSEMTMDDFVD